MEGFVPAASARSGRSARWIPSPRSSKLAREEGVLWTESSNALVSRM